MPDFSASPRPASIAMGSVGAKRRNPRDLREPTLRIGTQRILRVHVFDGLARQCSPLKLFVLNFVMQITDFAHQCEFVAATKIDLFT